MFPLQVSKDMLVYKDMVVDGWRGCISCSCIDNTEVQVTDVKGGDHVMKLLAFCPSHTADLSACHGQESGGLRLYLHFLRCPLSDWQSVVI